MQRIRITRGTVCGGVTVSVGDVVDATDNDARILVALRKAVPVDDGDPEALDDAPADAGDAETPRRRPGRPRKVVEE